MKSYTPHFFHIPAGHTTAPKIARAWGVPMADVYILMEAGLLPRIQKQVGVGSRKFSFVKKEDAQEFYRGHADGNGKLQFSQEEISKIIKTNQEYKERKAKKSEADEASLKEELT